MRRLREVGNTLQCPSTNNYWQMWLEDLAEAKQAKQRADLEAQSKTLEAQLRHSRFELGQLKVEASTEATATDAMHQPDRHLHPRDPPLPRP